MSSLDNMKKRLELLGGGSQIDRFNDNKLRTLKRVLYSSYQSATMINGLNQEFKCLINRSKQSNDHDIKVLSIPYEDLCLTTGTVMPTGVKVGQSFIWKENNSRWLICLQRLEETAYFRAEIRRCRFSIDVNGTRYWVYLRGPVETGMVWGRSGYTYFNKLNETAFMYVEKNEETEEFFSRFRKLKLGNQHWEVQATDKISVDGIIEVALKEDYVNNFEPIPAIDEQEIILADDSVDPMICGDSSVKPYDRVIYTVSKIQGGGRWLISDSSKAKIKEVKDDKTVEIEIITGKSGSFTLAYELGEQRIEYLVKILSL